LQEKLQPPAAMTSARLTAFSAAGTRAAGTRAEQLRLGLPADGWPDQTLRGNCSRLFL
jgi:hypothetical protein